MVVIEEHKEGEEGSQIQEDSKNGGDDAEINSEIGLEQGITSLAIVASTDEEDEREEEEEDGEEDEVWGRGGLKGFLQKPDEPWKISRQYFPSKAGGSPAWLDPVNVPRAKQASCGICDKPMQFVLQVYAPVDDDESAFHRTLFLFMCTSLACLQQDLSQQGRKDKRKRSVKVLRNQLPHQNGYYSASPPKADGSQSPLCEGASLCSWCGTWKGDKVCGGCKQTRYCSQTHQMDHWRESHAPTCRQEQERLRASSTSTSTDGEEAETPSLSHPICPNLWPEFELIVDDSGEDYQEDSDDELHARDRVGRLLSEYENRRRQGRDQFSSKDVQDVEESSAEEQHWAAFQARLSKTPEQVIWYLRSVNAKPLWPRLDGRPKDTDIPVCSHCGGNRIFEFQILPQLLYFFQTKDDPDSLDWGTIAVYSCAKSCTVQGYCEEFAWSVTPTLALGGEAFWLGHQRKSGVGFAARYNTDKVIATGQIASTGMVSLASDFMYNWMSKEATTSVGYDYLLRTCRLRGRFDTNGCVAAYLEEGLNVGVNFLLSAEIDHWKKDYYKFGFGMTVGE